MSKPRNRVLRRNFLKRGVDCRDEGIEGSRLDPAQRRLDLAPHLLDGVEIRGIGGQEADVRPGGADELRDARGAVRQEVVEGDDVAGAQRRHERRLRVHEEHSRVRRPVHRHAGGRPVGPERGDHGLRRPVPVGRVVHRPLPPGRPPVEPRHVRLRGGFVDEDEPVDGRGAHARLPCLAFGADVFAALLLRAERLFFNVIPIFPSTACIAWPVTGRPMWSRIIQRVTPGLRLTSSRMASWWDGVMVGLRPAFA